MDSIVIFLKTTSPIWIAIGILGFFLKVFLEKRLMGIAGRVEEIGKTSLSVKKDLRGEERNELVGLRVAIEKWEDCLLSAIFDYSTKNPSQAEVNDFFEIEKKLYLDVKIGVVRASTYLRNHELEQQLMSAIGKIRNTYNPLIQNSLPALIDLQSQLMVYEVKLANFQKSGMQDMRFAPTAADRDENSRLQQLLTAEAQKFSDALIERYRPIAEQMAEVKEAINVYIYRPIKETDIDRE